MPVLVDPTLLLSYNEWKEVLKKPSWYNNEEYILTYFLGEQPKAITEMTEKIAEEYNLKIIRLNELQFDEKFSVGPDEFIYLISKASLVFTDSFHGTVFSILFKTPFIVCDRVERGVCSMTSRLDTLLDMFGLKNRHLKLENNYKINNLFEVDFTNVEKILDIERNKSDKYLQEALNL